MRVNYIDLTQVDGLYGAQKDGVWYRVKVERCLRIHLHLCNIFQAVARSVCIQCPCPDG